LLKWKLLSKEENSSEGENRNGQAAEVNVSVFIIFGAGVAAPDKCKYTGGGQDRGVLHS
jgi:hypothetical protein